jgi:uncharacterized protein
MDRPPLPSFTLETATQKARMAEDAWNTRDPARVALAINDLPIAEGERKYHWPLGRRPDKHPSLSDLGL